MSPILERVNGEADTDTIFEKLLRRLEETYAALNIPKPDPLPSFERSVNLFLMIYLTYLVDRNKISFSIVFAGTKVRQLPDDVISSNIISTMHSALKEKGYLCEKDIKGKSLSLRVEVFEVAVRDN